MITNAPGKTTNRQKHKADFTLLKGNNISECCLLSTGIEYTNYRTWVMVAATNPQQGRKNPGFYV